MCCVGEGGVGGRVYLLSCNEVGCGGDVSREGGNCRGGVEDGLMGRLCGRDSGVLDHVCCSYPSGSVPGHLCSSFLTGGTGVRQVFISVKKLSIQ